MELYEKNWRAHIAKYVNLQKDLKKKGDGCSPEKYCSEEHLDIHAFRIWIDFIKKEDEYTFFQSFATEYLKRSKKSLELLEKYMDKDPNLRMPLIRNAIVAYAAPFSKSEGRIFTKWSLKKIEEKIPESLKPTHQKICEHRDTIIAHCDIGPRDPKVGLLGIVLRGAGFYWEDYKALMPDFKILIEEVYKELINYIKRENLVSVQDAFEEFMDPPESALDDPGFL
ncbi:MAG: hypothetical protein GY707_06485 [Desulfobacteraceae bacterium]|nr:hypothetical protein [Desulfobacteraceae bacterium]